MPKEGSGVCFINKMISRMKISSSLILLLLASSAAILSVTSVVPVHAESVKGQVGNLHSPAKVRSVYTQCFLELVVKIGWRQDDRRRCCFLFYTTFDTFILLDCQDFNLLISILGFLFFFENILLLLRLLFILPF